MLSSFASVGFCGSRKLPVSAQPLVSAIVQSVVATSRTRLSAGCSVGADAQVILSVPKHELSRLTIFSAFGYGGVGSCYLSSVRSVLTALREGASVRWWSGGIPTVGLRQRLALRSVAMVKHLAHNQPSALVCFLSSPCSRGSLLACRLAARLGVSVFVFCVGFSPVFYLAGSCTRLPAGQWGLPQLRRGGHWVPVSVAGYSTFYWCAG